MIAVQHRGVVPAFRSIYRKECAQFDCRSADPVDDAAGAGTAWRLQQSGQEIPDEVPQPLLRDAGQVDLATTIWKPHAVVIGFNEPGDLRLGRGEVDQSQFVQDVFDDGVGEIGVLATDELILDQRFEILCPTGSTTPEAKSGPTFWAGLAGFG